ncbi:MAG: hypothetical protein AVDCRST_MAG19-642, partial [uncultured Thermomicrobiales bacterium]
WTRRRSASPFSSSAWCCSTSPPSASGWTPAPGRGTARTG